MYALAGTLLPFLGAAMGGLVAASISGAAAAGLASQVAAVPKYLSTVGTFLGEGYLLDAVVITMLLASYGAVSVFVAERAAAWVRPERGARSPATVVWALRLLAGVMVVCGLLLITNPVASWLQAAFMFAGAGTLAFRRAGNS